MIPSLNSIPSMTSCSRFGPEIRRHFLLADIISLKTMMRTVLRFRQPLVFLVRFLTVEKTPSTGLVVRMCFRRSAGNAWKVMSSSRSLTSFRTAFLYLTPQVSAKRSNAASASFLVLAFQMFRKPDLALS